MGRFRDSPELFGEGQGSGTSCEIVCEWCGVIHNKGVDEDGANLVMETVLYTEFGGKVVCDCCFDVIEKEIFSRRISVVEWIREIMKSNIKASQEMLDIISGKDESKK